MRVLARKAAATQAGGPSLSRLYKTHTIVLKAAFVLYDSQYAVAEHDLSLTLQGMNAKMLVMTLEDIEALSGYVRQTSRTEPGGNNGVTNCVEPVQRFVAGQCLYAMASLFKPASVLCRRAMPCMPWSWR